MYSPREKSQPPRQSSRGGLDEPGTNTLGTRSHRERQQVEVGWGWSRTPGGRLHPRPFLRPGARLLMASPWPGVTLVGDGMMVPCADRNERPYLSFDAAASTPSLVPVADRVAQFLPWYSSIHRGAGYKSQAATAAYEQAREALLRFAGRADGDTAIICRNTTEAINHLAYRLRLEPTDVVLTTVVEHHANLLPWGRVATRRYVECGRDGTFGVDDVVAGLEQRPRPKLLAITGASNVSGWLPPLEEIIAAAHERGVPGAG